MLSQDANDRLTQVGPGTPGGRLLRRYWHPVAILSELTAERPACRVRLLGEDLVVFRTPAGQLGCLAERCAHRGCSLYYGFAEDDGLRCAYHGWKYDPDGRCLEQPFEPAGSRYAAQIRQTAYPVQALAGLAFAYLGPPPVPLLPRWDVLVREDGVRKLQVRGVLECNWLQPMENTVDTVHRYYLHSHMLQTMGRLNRNAAYYYRHITRYEYELCEWGISKRCDYVDERTGALDVEIMPPLIFPNILRIPAGREECVHWRVPMDDDHTRLLVASFLPSEDGSSPPPGPPALEVLPPGLKPDGAYDLESFFSQDRMAWETQGSRYDRTQEHLGASDRGVVLLRKLLADQIALVEAGDEPMNVLRDPARNACIEFEHTLPLLPG